MKRLRTLLRTVMAVTTGLIVAGTVAVPATAHHPEYGPTLFETSVLGDDLCSQFETAGKAGWPAVHPPEPVHVQVTGRAWISQVPDAKWCLDIVLRERQIEFVGYAGDRPVAKHVEPSSVFFGSDAGYEFTLGSRTGEVIEYMTVAICLIPEADQPDWRDRCGDSTIVVRPAR